MRIKDSSGFWIEFIRRREGMEMFLKQSFLPDAKVMEKIGKEAISSIKGSKKNKIMIQKVGGQVVINTVPNGSYKYGIMKETSPSGFSYRRLEDSTKRFITDQRKKGALPSKVGFPILRRTNEHIFNAMIVKTLKETWKTSACTIGFNSPENEEIAMLHHFGGESAPTLWFDDEYVSSTIPPRRFWAFQEEFIQNFYDSMKQLL